MHLRPALLVLPNELVEWAVLLPPVGGGMPLADLPLGPEVPEDGKGSNSALRLLH